MKFGLQESTIQKICSVFEKYQQVNQVIIYGSRAKGNYKNGSDIDLTLEGANLSHRIMSKIATELDDLLLPYKIDISLYDQITNRDLLDHIQRVGLPFYIKVTSKEQIS